MSVADDAARILGAASREARLPESVLSSLRLRGRRAVVFFVKGDSASARAKAVQDFADQAARFEALACKLVAVWPRSRAAEAQEALPTAESTVAYCLADEEGLLTTACGFGEDDSPVSSARKAVSACVVAANGSIAGRVLEAVAAPARASVALRLLESHDEAVDKEEARRAAMRGQALFAAANRRVRSRALLRSAGSTGIHDELEREILAAANRMNAASAKKRTAEAEMARAVEESGDEIVLRSAASLVQEAAEEELTAAYDHLWMTRKQVDALRAPINQLSQAAARAEREAQDVRRRAVLLRAKLTQSEVSILGLRAERPRTLIFAAEERRAKEEERLAEATAIRAAAAKDSARAAEGELQVKLKLIEASAANVQKLSDAAHGRRFTP